MPIELKDISKWLSDATNTAVRESKELARKGKLQVDIMGLKHQTAQALTELGIQTYQLIQKDKTEKIATDARIQELVTKVHDLELKLKRAEKDKKAKKYA